MKKPTMKKQLLHIVLGTLAWGAITGASAQSTDNAIRIGFITDMSGPYADTDGPGGLEAIKMAVKDFGGKVLGKKIEVLSADHQNKAEDRKSTRLNSSH